MSTRPYLGANVSPASAEELRQRGIIEDDERLLAMFDGMLLDEKRQRVGGISLCDFVALTDRRLITWARGFFNDTVDSFPWADVDVASSESWDPFHGRVLLAFRLPAVAPRARRIVVKGLNVAESADERVIVNTLDYMPADDVQPMASMVAWAGDQALAGLAGEELALAFTAEFPAPERQPLMPFFAAPQPEPPAPPPAPAEQPRRRWWQRAQAEDAEQASTGNLIADYESRRGGAPAGAPQMAQMPMGSQMPSLPEAPNMYEISRSLRLFLEAPRRLARGMRRASEMVGGASDLVSGMQDPQVRRNAMRGIYAAAAQQEAEGGPLASVAPVVRAAVRFSEPLDGEQAAGQARRNIQVRAAARRSTPVQPEEAPAPRPAPRAAAPAPAADAAPVRRSISVRRIEPAAEAPAPAAEVPAAPAAPRTPVRRLVVSRDSGSGDRQPADDAL